MKEFTDLLTTIKALRNKETGCPWDREQTLKTLIKPLQEETNELLEAINEEDTPHIAEELGDVVWNALMLLVTAEEEGISPSAAILSKVNNKMLARHPHVFGEEKATTLDEAKIAYSRAKEVQQRDQNDS